MTSIDNLAQQMWPTVKVVFSGINADQIKRWYCDHCGESISLLDAVNGDVETYRIKGDSANGYEMFHKTCLDEKQGVITVTDVAAPVVKMTKHCMECGRKFDLSNEEDAAEWSYGHDCE